ncbi:MAG: hypothetical protein ACYTGL_08755 [Planctomycetota bacterium]|jgi:hypothetical protein
MTQFIRFRVEDAGRFVALRDVFTEIKSVKNLDSPLETEEPDDDVDFEYNPDRIRDLMPQGVQANFIWPSVDESESHRLPLDKPVAISLPGSLLGVKWSFPRLLDVIDMCEYSLQTCAMVDDTTAEMHVETWGYPYGGLNGLMGLIEGFGFYILGADECGQYESREELERNLRS